jgi:hypothetical protein
MSHWVIGMIVVLIAGLEPAISLVIYMFFDAISQISRPGRMVGRCGFRVDSPPSIADGFNADLRMVVVLPCKAQLVWVFSSDVFLRDAPAAGVILLGRTIMRGAVLLRLEQGRHCNANRVISHQTRMGRSRSLVRVNSSIVDSRRIRAILAVFLFGRTRLPLMSH